MSRGPKIFLPWVRRPGDDYATCLCRGAVQGKVLPESQEILWDPLVMPAIPQISSRGG